MIANGKTQMAERKRVQARSDAFFNALLAAHPEKRFTPPVRRVMPFKKPSGPPVRDWLYISKPAPAPAPVAAPEPAPAPTEPDCHFSDTRLTVRKIIMQTAAHYMIEPIEIVSHRRAASITVPRQVAMYLAKTLTLRSLPQIGRRFGGRDHTTVLHAVRKITGLVATDQNLATEIAAIEQELHQGRAA